jgi:large subunit ribosomal protein L12
MEYAYATCLLNESGEEINEQNLTAVLEAANSEVHESRIKALVAALEDIEIDSAVDFDELGSDPAQNGEATTEEPSEPVEPDLTEASGMDLVPADAEDGFDGSGGTNGAADAEAGGPEESPDDDAAESAAVPADRNGDEASGAETETGTDSGEV